jgi:tRNA-dihydrouridine synthase C
MPILLAPMEGLLDFVLRDVLTRVGGIDRCVSEFIRVTQTQLPDKVFYRIVPELHHGGRTFAGVPVRPQLLGSDPACMADNAARLAQLGPFGIDLNFGCPAKVVNRHGGGAALLQEPEQIFKIVSAVRKAVPAIMPVSAKMRLGFNDDTRAEENALAMQAGGASELVVHGRTKANGYRPPAYWNRIADIGQVVSIPVTANGEIWTVADANLCRKESGCDSIMLGRGMVSNPGLALEINGQSFQHKGIAWHELLVSVYDFWELVSAQLEPQQQAGRLKQWLNLLRRQYSPAQLAYDQICPLTQARQIDNWFAQQGFFRSERSENLNVIT